MYNPEFRWFVLHTHCYITTKIISGVALLWNTIGWD